MGQWWTPELRMQCWFLLLALLLEAVLPLPLHQSYSVPEDFSAPLELPQQHFGLVDDYGIKPKQPHFRTTAPRKQLAVLHRAGKTKRDELDLEYYYDAQL
ncbi:protein Frey 1 [Excalfactoria chinensis]|uniref:protein Frey 1 n=1 Tax=Excalfactoria chinensis TaxID=46218 RepID=UPI003B3A892D